MQAIDVGQQDQTIGTGHFADARSQAIVIAVTDFLGRDRIVFIDNRNYTERKQGLQRTAGIQVATPVFRVIRCQQYLRDLNVMAVEQVLVGVGQKNLAGRGRGLMFFQSPLVICKV